MTPIAPRSLLTLHGSPHDPRCSPGSAAGASTTGPPAVGIWVVALVAVFTASGVIGPNYDGVLDIPDSDSADGFDVLEQHFPGLGVGGLRAPSSSGPTRASTTPRSSRRWTSCSPRSTPAFPTGAASPGIPVRPSCRPTPSKGGADRP